MRNVVSWFASNHIAANLIMVLIIVGGVNSIFNLDKEFFPASKLNQISVTVDYLGASPQEVENQICLRIEDALEGLDGVRELECVAREGYGRVKIDIDYGYEKTVILNEVNTRVGGITTFPQEARPPIVQDVAWKSRVLTVALYGNLPEREFKELGLQIRDEISELNEVQVATLNYPRDYEFSIEISQNKLREYGITFSQVADAVRQYSITTPAGKLRTKDGNIQIQTKNQSNLAQDFSNIVLLKTKDGSQVLLGDIARLADGFVEDEWNTRINNVSGYGVNVYITQSPNILATSKAVRQFIDKRRQSLPSGVEMEMWYDMTESYKGRINTLVTNGISGLILVFIVLLLFLRPAIAIWVIIGIAVAFMGGLWMLPNTGTSLNIVSLFAFLLVLGVVVDDAIIVSESIYSMQERGLVGQNAAVEGTVDVFMPVAFAVTTSLVFFGAMLFMPETMSDAYSIAWVAVFVLLFSLLESMIILPSHLASMGVEKNETRFGLRHLQQVRRICAAGLKTACNRWFRPLLHQCLQAKMVTLAVFFVMFFVPVSYWLGGRLITTGMPDVQADFIFAETVLAEGTAFNQVEKVADHLEAAAQKFKHQLNSESEIPFIGSIQRSAYNNRTYLMIKLINFEKITYHNDELVAILEDYIGELPQVEEFSVSGKLLERGKPISFDITSTNLQALGVASAEVKKILKDYSGVYNVRDSIENPRTEILLEPKNALDTLNISLASVARQVRQAFYGEEAQRIPRLREDVKVMVRYPFEERSSVGNLTQMWVSTADGQEVPLSTVASLKYQDSFTHIKRINRKRQVRLTADALKDVPIGQIMRRIETEVLPTLKQQYTDINITASGKQKDEAELFTNTILITVASIIVIYSLMAVIFQSYLQPMMVISAIPFGMMGAVLGHLILGLNMSLFSIMGIIACSGVVVNDNLILLHKINKLMKENPNDILWAVEEAAVDRFRAILLTSVTTFIGVIPIMLEKSVQAQFLIPMVTSLGFGVFFATFVTLLLVPTLYVSLYALRLKGKLVMDFLLGKMTDNNG